MDAAGLVTTPMSSTTAGHSAATNSVLQGDPERRPNITEDGYKIVDCRGIPLLAIPYNHVLYICVHEISMALWEKFDTPRVSVQKKITDLGIHLHQTTKSQVEILRRERIIGNFRATMITVRDAEKLYDALEYSRRKRGLVKHILKDPGKRGVRAEEYGARKLSRTVRHHQNGTPIGRGSASCSRPNSIGSIVASSSTPQPHRTHGSTLNGPRHTLPRDSPSSAFMGCALNGTPLAAGIPPHDARLELHRVSGKAISTTWEREEERCSYGDLLGLRFDVLFRAGDPEILGGKADFKDHYIELLQNKISKTGASSSRSSNSGSRNSSVGAPAISTASDEATESSAARVRVHTHMDRDSQRRHNPSTATRDHIVQQTHSVSTPNNHSLPRRQPPVSNLSGSSSKRRLTKSHDPDYQPSAYAVKSTQRNLSSSSSQSKRLSRNRERDQSIPSTSTGSGSRVNSLRYRHLSSPPLELQELEEGSSVYSGLSANSSRLQSSTPERFLYLDESSSEGEEEYEQEEEREKDSVFIIERSSSPEMKITVPGKGSSAPDRRIVRTKLCHFAQTTSPQMTALSRGKHLPLRLESSPTPPPPPSPPSLPSPLTVSISLDQIHSYQNQSTCDSTLGSSSSPPPPPSIINTAGFVPSQQSSVKVHKHAKGGRPLKNKTRRTALSSFVMKKRASSPSSLMQCDDSDVHVRPPPAKKARMGSESDSSANDRGAGGPGDACKSGTDSGIEGGTSSSSSLTVKRQFRSATGTGSTNYYSILSSSRAPGPPVIPKQSDPIETVDDVEPVNEKSIGLQHQGSPNGFWDVQAEDVRDGGSNLANGGRRNPHQLVLLDEDDRYSVASSTTSAPTMTNQSSLTSSSKGKTQASITPTAGGTTPGPSAPPSQRRGRPPKTSYSNGGNLASELQSLTSKSKSSINFEKFFSYYPPKLVVRDGELQPERSLSIKGSAIGGLPEGHPFLSWNLGQPVKAGNTLRGRGRKRKPPKAVHVT